jgi:hypothetical protein
MKSIETQLAEKDAELRELRKTTNNQGLTLQLAESGLPPAAQARLRKRFESAGNLDGLKTAIAEEHEYIRQVRKAAARTGAGRSAEVQESDARTRSLVEGYQAFGLSEKEAKLAAGVEVAVEGVKESQEQLFHAAKSMGMSDAEAKAFSEPARSSSW